MGPGGGAAALGDLPDVDVRQPDPGPADAGHGDGAGGAPDVAGGGDRRGVRGSPGRGGLGEGRERQGPVLDPNPLLPPETVAKTDKDGRFTFTDRRFTTGTLEVKARVGSEVHAATAYAVQLTDTKALQNPAIAALARAGRFEQVATVEIVVPPLETPPPPPAVGIHVMRMVDGKRVLTDGLVTRGTPVPPFGFKSSRNLEVRGAEVEGQQLQVVPEDLSGTTAGAPWRWTSWGGTRGVPTGLPAGADGPAPGEGGGEPGDGGHHAGGTVRSDFPGGGGRRRGTARRGRARLRCDRGADAPEERGGWRPGEPAAAGGVHGAGEKRPGRCLPRRRSSGWAGRSKWWTRSR